MDGISAAGELGGACEAPAASRSEAELVIAARSDPRAFEELYRLHQRPIWRYLRHRTGESHAADDLLGEVFLEFLRSLPGVRPRGMGVRGWLSRVATRRVARWAKRRRAEESYDDALHARAAAPARDSAARVRAALETLPQRYQAVLLLHHLEGLAVEEIAASLGARVGTIKSRLARGREELGRRLGRQGEAG